MTRVGYMSDLHTEFEGKGPSNPSGEWFSMRRRRRELAAQGHPEVGPLLDGIRDRIDMMVIAGDTATAKGRIKGRSGIQYADCVAKYLDIPVVMIAGNHEFYDGDLDEENRELHTEARATEGRVQFLECERWVFDRDGERLHVLGCTLWTDFALFGNADAVQQASAREMTDFASIRCRGETFSPKVALDLHHRSREWIGSVMSDLRRKEPHAKILLVTHHAPSLRSVPEALRKDVLTAAYASNLENEIARWRPDVWLHGHLHGACDYTLGGVRIVSGARGYIGLEQGVETFCPGVIDI
jgi:DNA repair exonuclease SbcCD nuclease subunit